MKELTDQSDEKVDGTKAAEYTSVHVGPYTGKDNQKWRLNMIRLFQ